MRIRDYYDIYRKKPTADKIDMLIEEVCRMKERERQASEARILNHNEEAYQYYHSEQLAMRERARWLRWAILQEINE